MSYGVDASGSDNGVSGIGGNDDYDDHEDSHGSDDFSRTDFDNAMRANDGADEDIYGGDSHHDDDDDETSGNHSTHDFHQATRRSTGLDIYGSPLLERSDGDVSNHRLDVSLLQHNPVKSMDLFVNKGYQVQGSLFETFKNMLGVIGNGITAGYDAVVNTIKSGWDYQTDSSARGQEIAEILSSDYYKENVFGTFAWAYTFSPTSYVIEDSWLGGTGGVINNSPANVYAAGAIGAGKLIEGIYNDVTTERAPSEDLLDIGSAFEYTRNLNTPHDIPGYQFERPYSP